VRHPAAAGMIPTRIAMVNFRRINPQPFTNGSGIPSLSEHFSSESFLFPFFDFLFPNWHIENRINRR
jgi:hypothetical protein